MKYFYGPVYSRRLGFSLGINLFPKKLCSFNCIYCQLGRTRRRRIERVSLVNFSQFKKEFKEIIKRNPKIDYITFSGCGEPTLHKNLDRLIGIIKKVIKDKHPVCLITNSSLLYRKEIREELKNIDLIIPSLDAPQEKLFKKINSPHKKISFSKIVEGLIEFRKDYKSIKFWLEIMLVKDFNDKEEIAYEFKKIIKKINPDKVQLNLPLRPNPSSKINFTPSYSIVRKFKTILGKNCEIVKLKKTKGGEKRIMEKEIILNSLKSRPQTIEDLATAFGTDKKILEDAVRNLLKKGIVERVEKDKKIYFLAK